MTASIQNCITATTNRPFLIASNEIFFFFLWWEQFFLLIFYFFFIMMLFLLFMLRFLFFSFLEEYFFITYSKNTSKFLLHDNIFYTISSRLYILSFIKFKFSYCSTNSNKRIVSYTYNLNPFSWSFIWYRSINFQYIFSSCSVNNLRIIGIIWVFSFCSISCVLFIFSFDLIDTVDISTLQMFLFNTVSILPIFK